MSMALAYGGSAAVTTTSATTAHGRVSTSPAGPPASARRLRAIVLQPAEVPAGWASQPGGPSPTQAADSAAFATCIGGRDTTPDIFAAAYSPIFSMGSQTITSSATSFRFASDVTSDTAALSNPSATACLTTVLRRRLVAALPQGTTLKKLTVKITPGHGSGPSNVAGTISATATLMSSGAPMTMLDSVAIITGPRIEAQVSFISLGTQVPAQLRAALITKVATRAALG